MFSSTQLFAEVLVVGLFLLVGISPFLVRFFAEPGQVESLLGLGSDHALGKSWLTTALVLALVYGFGIAGNRLVADLIKLTEKVPHANCDVASGPPAQAGDIETAELWLRNQSTGAKEWVDRHHSYRHILLAGASSSALFLISVLVCLLASRRNEKTYPKYTRKHILAAVMLLVVFTYAYESEMIRYHRHVCKLFVYLAHPNGASGTGVPRAAAE
jgi:hypothetical protein